MLKETLLSILTVEQWSEFKKYMQDKTYPVWVDSDGAGHADFPTHDVHEFLKFKGVV
jgi:hypothetical protein